ncbi:MAG: hypothetical protein ABIK83_10750 [Candidatus Zixiibacteriota bacterium]
MFSADPRESFHLPGIVRLSIVILMILFCSPGVSSAQATDPIDVSIDLAYGILLGDTIIVHVNLNNPDSVRELDHISLLIQYPEDALIFNGASPSDLLEDCAWESFTFSEPGSNLILLTATADAAGIPGEPNCYLEGFSGRLANLSFAVIVNPENDCTSFPLQFYWQECQDNYLTLKDVSEYIVSDYVFVWDWANGYMGLPMVDTLPSYAGTPDSCLSEYPVGSDVTRLADFYGGGIDIICSDSIDYTGDLNLNGIPNEIADFVVYYNYLLFGLAAFTINVDAQIATSDINNDGIVLSYRDFVYLWRIIIGDALPYPKSDQVAKYPVMFVQHDPDSISVLFSDVPLAGAYLIFDGSIVPTLIPTEFEMGYNYDSASNETRVVIRPVDRETTIGNGPLITFGGLGTLIDAYTADYENSQFDITISVQGSDLTVFYVVQMLNYIFAEGAFPSPAEYADADCSGAVDIDDVVYVIRYLFNGGPAPGGC